MPVETGNLSRLGYIQELTIGTTPSTPTGQLVRWKAFELDANRNYIDNTELRADSMVAAGRGGALRGKGMIDGLLSYGTYDDFFAASCGMYGWVSNVVKIQPVIAGTQTTLQMTASSRTLTRPAGSFVTDGFAVGDYVILSGFTNAGNNGICQLSTVNALTMVFAVSAALTPVDEAANPLGKVTRSIRPSFTMERQHLINGMYFTFPGVVVGGFDLSGKVNSAVEVKFELFSKAVSTESTSSVFTTVTAANTNNLITAWDGTVKKGATTLANVVGWDLKLTRNLDLAEVVGSSVLYDIQPKATKITGSMELYFDSYALYTDMRSEADLALQLNLGPGGTLSYQLDLTKVRVKSWKSVPKDGLMTASIEFESFVPASGTNTSFMLTRLP